MCTHFEWLFRVVPEEGDRAVYSYGWYLPVLQFGKKKSTIFFHALFQFNKRQTWEKVGF